ncbi:MAG: hypothetical protein RH945_11500 [Hyphomonas sp.]
MKYAVYALFVPMLSAGAHAEVVAAAPDHYELRQEAVSTLAPAKCGTG